MLTPEDRRRQALEDGSGASSYLSGHRFGTGEQYDLFDTDDTSKAGSGAKKRTLPPTGKSLEGKHGIQESQRIAAEARALDTRSLEEIRETNRLGRAALTPLQHPRSDTPQARFDADRAEIDPDYYAEQLTSAETTFRARQRAEAERQK